MKKSLMILFFACLSLLNFAQAADSQVESFRIEGLEGFAGKNLSVLYVSARPASIATPGQIAKVRKILKGPITLRISDQGEVVVPEAQVPRDGWSSFNHILFVVHAQSQYSLQNADGTLPDVFDQDHAVPFKTEYSQFLYRKSLEINRLDLSSGALRLY